MCVLAFATRKQVLEKFAQERQSKMTALTQGLRKWNLTHGRQRKEPAG
jgi:hypothetical protein